MITAASDKQLFPGSSLAELISNGELRSGCTDVLSVPTSGSGVNARTISLYLPTEQSNASYESQSDLLSSFSTAPLQWYLGVLEAYEFRWDINNQPSHGIHCGLCILPPVVPPTLARDLDVAAYETDFGNLIRWRTGYEVDNLGFRVWRESNGERVAVNRSLIAGSALFAGPGTELTAGHAYALWDVPPAVGESIRYWIEDVDLSGQTEMRGPFYAEPISGEALDRLLAEVETGGSPSIGELTAQRPSRQEARSLEVGGDRVPGVPWSGASQPAAKLDVVEEGWYRVTRSELAAAGFDPGSDATNLQLLNQGEEVAIQVTGLDDGFFDMQDAVEFYGLGLDTPATGTSVYWLVVGSSPGRRIDVVNPTTNARISAWAEHFPYTVEREDRTTYFAALVENGDRDNFYGAVVSSTPVEQTLTVEAQPVADRAPRPVQLEVALQGVTDGEHRVEVAVNGAVLDEMVFSGRDAATQLFRIDSSYLLEGDNTVTLTALNGAADVSLVERISLTYARRFHTQDEALRMTAEQGASLRITGFSTPSVRLVDVSDPAGVTELQGRTYNAGLLGAAFLSANRPPGWQPGHVTTLFAFSQDRVASPARIRANVPSAWGSASNTADLVIFTSSEFEAATQRLAGHRQAQGFEVAVVNVEDVYDEFAFGVKSPKAIREFLENATARWTEAPQWVLFFGDATFDPRNYLGFGDFDFVPTWIGPAELLKTAIDDELAPCDAQGVPELAIGRIPVRTAADAEAVVDKLIAYDGLAPNDRVALFAGQNDKPAYDFEGHAGMLAEVFPSELEKLQLNLADFGVGNATEVIVDTFNDGNLFVSYTGHGSVSTWTGGYFGIDDVGQLTNADALPVVLTMNCLNGAFQSVYQPSLAEALLTAPNAGAAAVLSSSALTGPNGQLSLNAAVVGQLFADESLTIGEAVVNAKAGVEEEDVRRTFMLFGDPTMRLNR